MHGKGKCAGAIAALALMSGVVSAQLTLTLDEPAGAGSLLVAVSGTPNDTVYTAFSFDPANQTNPGAGIWFGLHITPPDLLAQLFAGVPPFLLMLDGSGNASFSLPAGSVPPTIQAWGVTVGLGLTASNIAMYPPAASTPTFGLVPLSFASGGRHAGVGDIDQDGDLDLAISSAVWFNGGAFGFTAVAIDPGGTEAAVMNLFGDPNPELVVLDQVFLGLKVFPGNGTGVYLNSAPVQLPLVCEDDGHAVVRDLDGDGSPDLLCSTGTTVSGGFQKFLQLTPGQFFSVGAFPGADSAACAAGDYDGDGSQDLLVHDATAGVETLAFYSGSTMMPHSTATNLTSLLPEPTTRWLETGDLNGDGVEDALWAGATQVGALLSTGGGSFAFQPWGAVTECCGVLAMVSLGDVDGDGDLDAAWPTGGDAVVVAINDGTGAVATSVVLNLPTTDCGHVSLHDLDGDGDLDLFCGGTPATIFANL